MRVFSVVRPMGRTSSVLALRTWSSSSSPSSRVPPPIPQKKPGFSTPPPAPPAPPSPQGVSSGAGKSAGAQDGKSLIVDVGEANWDAEITRSEKPIILDVYADWCAPCKQLAPMLEQLARSTPSVKFCRLNSDVEERISGDLQIRSLPTLLAIFRGKLLEAPIVGLPTPKVLQEFVVRVSAAGGAISEQEQKADTLATLLNYGEQFLEMGDLQKAAQHFDKALKTAGPQEAAGPLAGLALCAMSQGDIQVADELLKQVKTIKGHDSISIVKRALGSVGLAKDLQSLVEELKDAKFEPKSKDDQFRRAVMQCLNGRLDEAIDSLVGLIRADKAFRTQQGMVSPKELLFKLFASLGPNHPGAIAGRKKLAQALFV